MELRASFDVIAHRVLRDAHQAPQGRLGWSMRQVCESWRGADRCVVEPWQNSGSGLEVHLVPPSLGIRPRAGDRSRCWLAASRRLRDCNARSPARPYARRAEIPVAGPRRGKVSGTDFAFRFLTPFCVAEICSLAVCPTGEAAGTGTTDGKLRLWTLPRPSTAAPGPMTSWLRVITGIELDRGGAFRFLTPEQWDDARSFRCRMSRRQTSICRSRT